MIILLRWLGGLKLTLAFFLLLIATVSVMYLTQVRSSLWLVVSLALLASNLLAAIATNPYFRRQLPLLLFHLALLMIILLVAVGRLTYLRGQAEVIEGTEFMGRLIKTEAGVGHGGEIANVRFVNHGFDIAYAEGLTRLGTQNRVTWVDESGTQQEKVIGDHVPLVIGNYHFYTTSNKGFALLFEWRPNTGASRIGSVNLPSYPANTLKQAQQWSLPGLAEPVWAMLQFEGDLISATQAGVFRLPNEYAVVVRYGDQRWVLPIATAETLARGETTIKLPEGELVYLGLRSWMGYLVTYDRTLPWLLLSAVIAVLALAGHFWRKFSSTAWNL
jgi:cytochrome c biogenesis protein